MGLFVIETIRLINKPIQLAPSRATPQYVFTTAFLTDEITTQFPKEDAYVSDQLSHMTQEQVSVVGWLSTYGGNRESNPGLNG
jgi:hypothetical protein